jgi:hypothetical protein
MNQEQARQALVAIVTEEVRKYDMGQYWITDKVAFNMRELIKEFRKNYWGIYDVPVDPITKREKLWVPLTRTLCDAVRKSIDMDPKDVRFRSTDPDYTEITHLVRGVVRSYLRKTYFGHTLNQLSISLVRDGTRVWKTYKDGENLVRKDVDILDVYIDPTAESIQETQRFTERILMEETEVKRMDWGNTDKFKTSKDLEKNEGDTARKAGEYGDVYEMWGKVPANLLNAASGGDWNPDDIEMVDAHVVISGIDTGAITFHLAEKNTEKDAMGNIIKPYEEFWYIKVPGRWYGIGIAETVLQLQWWINTIVNLRINKNTVAQLGLLKVRKGSGVTQQMLANLVSKGVIELNDPDGDIQNMVVAEAGQSSYTDEGTARKWAQDVTSVFDINLGELPASSSATGAAIQDRQSQSAFSLIVESIEYGVQRWIDRHVLKHVPDMIKKDAKVTVFKDFEEIKKIRERVVASLVSDEMEKMYKKSGKVPTEQELQSLIDRMTRKLEERGDMVFEVIEDLIVSGLETEVFMTNSEMDIGVTVRNLLELRNGVDSVAAAQMTAQALDLLGLEVPQSLKNPPPMPQPGAPQGTDMGAILSDVQQVTAANTLGNEQR